MAWPNDIDMSADHEVWDGTEEVQYFQKTAEAPPASGWPIPGTLWLSIRKDRLSQDSVLVNLDMTVNLPKANMAEIVPERDDIMVRSDGSRWVIKLIEYVAKNNEYRVHVSQSRA